MNTQILPDEVPNEIVPLDEDIPVHKESYVTDMLWIHDGKNVYIETKDGKILVGLLQYEDFTSDDPIFFIGNNSDPIHLGDVKHIRLV